MEGENVQGSNLDESTETESTTETKSTEQTEDTKGATSETAKEQTFKDPNMDKQFTTKMQELAADRKSFEKDKQKAEAFDVLMGDEEASKFITGWHDKKTGKAKEDTEISDEEFDRVGTDKIALQQLIDSRSKTAAKNEYGSAITQLQSQFKSLRLEQDIDDFANAKGKDGTLLHPDFWDIDKAGKLEPYLVALRNSGMSGIQVVENAYKLAKYPNLKAEALQEAHTVVEEKKAAVGEKGSRVEASPDVSKLSFKEYARRKAKELKMDVP